LIKPILTLRDSTIYLILG